MTDREQPAADDRSALESVPSLAGKRAAKKAAQRVFATIEAAVTSGATEREVLAAVRARLARKLDDPNLSARDLASNSKRLLEVDRAIRAIDAGCGTHPGNGHQRRAVRLCGRDF